MRWGETWSRQGILMTFPACPEPISDFTLNCACDHLHNEWNKGQPGLYIGVRVRVGQVLASEFLLTEHLQPIVNLIPTLDTYCTHLATSFRILKGAIYLALQTSLQLSSRYNHQHPFLKRYCSEFKSSTRWVIEIFLIVRQQTIKKSSLVSAMSAKGALPVKPRGSCPCLVTKSTRLSSNT